MQEGGEVERLAQPAGAVLGQRHHRRVGGADEPRVAEDLELVVPGIAGGQAIDDLGRADRAVAEADRHREEVGDLPLGVGDPALGVDALGLVADKPAQEIGLVDGVGQRRAEAVAGRAHPRLAGRRPVARRETQPAVHGPRAALVLARQPGRADRAPVDRRAHLAVAPREAPAVADHQLDPGPRRGGDHRVGVRERVGQRFFAEDVLARRRRRHRLLAVQGLRRADDDEPDVGARQQVAVVGVPGQGAEEARRPRRLLLAHIGNRDESQPVAQARDRGQVSRVGDRAAADHPDAERQSAPRSHDGTPSLTGWRPSTLADSIVSLVRKLGRRPPARGAPGPRFGPVCHRMPPAPNRSWPDNCASAAGTCGRLSEAGCRLRGRLRPGAGRRGSWGPRGARASASAPRRSTEAWHCYCSNH